jgi:hypothetical protein
VGKRIINHPPVIPINRGYVYHSQTGGLWHCFIHTTYMNNVIICDIMWLCDKKCVCYVYLPCGVRKTHGDRMGIGKLTGERIVGFQSAPKSTSFEMLRNHQKLRGIPSRIREYEGYTGRFFWESSESSPSGLDPAIRLSIERGRTGKFGDRIYCSGLMASGWASALYFLVDLTQQHPG